MWASCCVFQCLGVSQPRVASSTQPACDYRARPRYIIQCLDETVAGEIQGITLTDRVPIMFSSPPRHSYITIPDFGWCLLSEITGLIV